MARPRKCRRIEDTPKVTYFKPRGIPMSSLTEVYLPVEGFEAIRLADHLGLSMDEAAERMNVSRHTFGRILNESRRTLAEALVEGRALLIEGGDYEIEQPDTSTAAMAGSCREPVPTEAWPLSGNTKERFMTKVAVTSEGPALTDMVDPRFGRAAGFVVVDTETMQTEYVDNGSSQALAHGAGIQAAENIARAGAATLLTGFVGPKAFQVLKAAGVNVGQNLDGMTVAEAVEKFTSGQVEFATQPNK